MRSGCVGLDCAEEEVDEFAVEGCVDGAGIEGRKLGGACIGM